MCIPLQTLEQSICRKWAGYLRGQRAEGTFGAFGMSCPLLVSVIIWLCKTFHPCFVSLGGPVSPASFTLIVCTWLSWLPMTYQCLRDSHQLPGVHTHKHTEACICPREHTSHIPIFLHSSSPSLCRSSIFLTRCCNIVVPFWHLPVRLHSSHMAAQSRATWTRLFGQKSN